MRRIVKVKHSFFEHNKPLFILCFDYTELENEEDIETHIVSFCSVKADYGEENVGQWHIKYKENA